MDIVELLQANWFNLVIIVVLPFVGFIYRKRSKNDYFDNIIKYTDILEKTPHPQYQTTYLNNIKKKLLWDKVCFYKAGDRNRERIAISLVNADVNNIIDLMQLDKLTRYFSIKRNCINPIIPFLIPEIAISSIALLIAVVIIISNISIIFSSTWLVTALISMLTVFIVLLITCRFTIAPMKRFNTYRLILKDKNFLQRANRELIQIIKTDEKTDSQNAGDESDT